MNFITEKNDWGETVIINDDKWNDVVFKPGRDTVSIDGDFTISEMEEIITEMKKHIEALKGKS